jgi:hypothetical protein
VDRERRVLRDMELCVLDGDWVCWNCGGTVPPSSRPGGPQPRRRTPQHQPPARHNRREGMTIDSVQQEPHSHTGCRSPFFAKDLFRAQVARTQC